MHHSILQRLAFAKYLFSVAVEQSKAPEILASASLLTFHDSIEFFLQIASEHLDAGKGQPNFMEYWDILSDAIDTDTLPQKEAMRRLNKARVALKHSGTLPSKLDIEAFRAATTLFFQEATKLVFKIEFSEISLIEYISSENARNHLRRAENLIRNSEYNDAASEIALAFEKIIFEYESDKRGLGVGSPFFFGRDMAFMSSFHMGLNRSEFPDIARFVDNVKESIEAMQQAVKILALGLDYRKYSKFKLLMPHVSRVHSGDYVVQQVGFASRKAKPDEEYLKFCIDFVIECAIKLNEFNYSITES